MDTLPPIGAFVRRHDPDRFLCTLFAPPAHRPALWTLYGFNHELARAGEAAREPTLALIRLQWWREVVEGQRKRHEVATPLGEALDTGTLDPSDLLALIEAREEPPEDDAGWLGFAHSTAGRLALTAAGVLGAPDPAVLAAGAAYGAAGLLRNRALRGMQPLPALRAAAHDWLEEARRGRIGRAALPAALPAVLAARDLRRERPAAHRRLGDKLAVAAAAFTGRL